MAESWAVGNRVFVEDSRGDGTYMRVTWHAQAQQFVVSHWHDDVCTAATRVPVSAAPDLVGLLVKGLGQAAERPPVPQPSRAGGPREWWRRVRRALRVLDRRVEPARPAPATGSGEPRRRTA